MRSAFGVGDIIEVQTAITGVKIPLWEVSDVSVPFHITVGREPLNNEAVVDVKLIEKLGWEVPSGTLQKNQGEEIAVVSGGIARSGYEDFADSALVKRDNLDSFRSIVIMADKLSDVEKIQNAVRSWLDQDSPDNLVFENSGLNIVAELTSGKYTRYAMSILFTVIAVGSVLSSIVSLTYVLIFSRTLGRRRALGITRIDLTLLTLARICIPILAGAVIGGALTYAVALVWFTAIPIYFTLSVVAFMVMFPSLCVLPPVLWAANRDPVAVLRTA